MPTTDLAKPDTDAQDPNSGYPTTANDYLSLLSDYWADVLEVDDVPDDSAFGRWERLARPIIEGLTKETAELRAELAAVETERADTFAALDANWISHQCVAKAEAELTAARAEIARLKQWVPRPESMSGFDDPDAPDDVRALIDEARKLRVRYTAPTDVRPRKWDAPEDEESTT